MKKFFEKIVDFMEENGSVRSEYREIYLFALQTVVVYAFHIATGIVIGIVMGELFYCGVFLAALILLRQEAGGYHAPGWKSCYFLSCGILILTLLWVKEKFIEQTYITMILTSISGIGICLFAPLEDQNKPLDQQEKRVIRKKAQVITAMESIVGTGLLFFDKKAAYAVFSSVIWCGFSYLAWAVKKYADKN